MGTRSKPRSQNPDVRVPGRKPMGRKRALGIKRLRRRVLASKFTRALESVLAGAAAARRRVDESLAAAGEGRTMRNRARRGKYTELTARGGGRDAEVV